MKLLVTGGAGFIGSHYARRVLGDAWGGTTPTSVVVLDKRGLRQREPAPRARRDDDRLRFVHGGVATTYA